MEVLERWVQQCCQSYLEYGRLVLVVNVGEDRVKQVIEVFEHEYSGRGIVVFTNGVHRLVLHRRHLATLDCSRVTINVVCDC